MIFVEKLGIQNYKCFRHFEIVFNEHLNIIVGNNEEGKSTILEALHLCLTGGKAYAQHREQSCYDRFFHILFFISRRASILTGRSLRDA